MVFLHPVFLVAFVFMILYSFMEINGQKKDWRVMLFLGLYLVIISGLRKNVGADYPVYEEMYRKYFPLFIEYKDLVPKMLLQESKIEIEWLYIALNKFIYQLSLGGPFYLLTLVVSITVIWIKFSVFYKNSAAPVLAVLIYFIPTYFISDSGHMRQGMSIALALYSFKFIKERKVWAYLFVIYLAFSFHKSVVVFLPAYWFATMNMNSRKILIAVAVCVILSPLQLYNSFDFLLDTISVQEISAGYDGYISYEVESSGAIKFYDILTFIYVALIVLYDEETCARIPYYEYMRNIGVLGVCIYFIMRENPMFSSRLVTSYYIFMPLIVSNIIYCIPVQGSKRIMHFGYVVFLVFYLFTFAKIQGNAGGFVTNRYQNFLWAK